MLRLFKTIGLYLLMLAIPVQGFAATTMLHCGFAHQHTPSAQEPSHVSVLGHAIGLVADQQHKMPAAASADSASYASIDAAAAFSAADNSLAKGGDAGAHGSSEHAACHAGAIAPASSLKFQHADATIERLDSKQRLNIAFVTGAPARPPRSSLA